MIAGADKKLPYGNLPRLLLAWISTEAVRTQSPVLVLGPSRTVLDPGPVLKAECAAADGTSAASFSQRLRCARAVRRRSAGVNLAGPGPPDRRPRRASA